MDGNEELDPNLKEEEFQNVLNPFPEPEVINSPTKTSFSSKIANIKASAQANLQKVNLLLGNKVSEISETGQLNVEIEALRSMRQTDNRWQIEQRLEDLQDVRGLRRISAALERRRLTKQKAGIQQEIEAIDSQIQAKRDQLARLQEQERSVRQKQEELIFGEIAQAVQLVKAGYEELLQEIIDEGTITKEIRDAYIKQVIVPKVEESCRDKKLPESKKEEFYKALQDYADHSNSSEEERQVSRDNLDSFLAHEEGFWQVQNDCQALMTSRDEQIVRLLVATMAAEDIAPIRAAAEPHYNIGWESSRRFAEAFNRVIQPVDRRGWDSRDPSSFDNEVLSALERTDKGYYPDMCFWQAIKDSPSANQAFGEMIKRQDQEYYQTALDKSLSDRDGGHIDLLQYYPTPDAIRNLVVLASADMENYRTVHANWVLSNLAKRPDWTAILDEAEKAYPSLKGARGALQVWAYTEYSNNPDIKDVVDDFALDIFESTSADQRLIALATESLTNGSMLTILAKRGVLTEREMVTIKGAGTFLKEISEEIWKRHREDDYSIPYIDEYMFRKSLRENLFALIVQQPGTVEEQRMAMIKRFELLSQAILENTTNYPALNYLTDTSIINTIKGSSFRTETLPILLEAYKACPSLLTNKGVDGNSFIGEFCRQFKGEPTVILFKDMSVAYQNYDKQLHQILILVGNGALSKERALELSAKAKAVLSSPRFSIAIAFPRLFLETDDGLEFFNQTNTSSLFSLDKGLGVRIGERVRKLQREGKLNFSNLLIKIAPHELKQLDKLLASETPIEVNQQNWQQLLMGYVRSQAGVFDLPQLSQVSTDRINGLFNDPKVKDICLSGLRNLWLTYLESGKPEEIPFPLIFMSRFINYCGGAGPLSQVESINRLISSVDLAFSRETTVERTKVEILQGMLRMEERFTKERWSNEDGADFYNISRDILIAAPSLFSDYLALFEKLTPSQMRLFAKDIYPLYRTKLVLMEKKDKEGHGIFDKEQLLHIRKDIRGFMDIFTAGEKPFEIQKQKLLEEIRGLFKDRFGIIKMPQEFSSEHIRSVTNVSTYLANFHDRTADKEAILGFYLSIMINDHWDAFRRGEAVDPSEYLTPEKSAVIRRILQQRQRLNPLTPDHLGISKEEMPEFLRLLQQETQNMVVGNLETIDVKLTNIILNLRGLEDLDLYPDLIDKQRMQLLLDWGNKKVGSVVAKMYQSLAAPGKAIQFSEEDTRIQQQITNAIRLLGLSLTPQILKEHFQDGIKPLATVINLLNFIEETRTGPEIESLRDLLKPSEEVIQIFKRLGEDFKSTSGAMALSQDLSYLDNLIVKKEDELTSEEKIPLMAYTARIREQVIKLEGIYGQIKNKFGSFRQGNAGQRNPLLQDKLDQLDRIVNAQTTQQAITSIATNNLNTIIENIRECLSCTREGSNNDTDLTFGDMNKFYLYSQSETQQRGSISDQIAFVEPITRADGSQGMAFVLDRIYGTSTPTILENQVETVLKKYKAIKQQFPNIHLSVLVSDAAILTGGTSLDMMRERFKQKNIIAVRELVEVDVVESAMGDHYVEFGGSSRTAGKRQITGLMIF